jgi:hypothetical protein
MREFFFGPLTSLLDFDKIKMTTRSLLKGRDVIGQEDADKNQDFGCRFD